MITIIRPSADLRNKYNEISVLAKEEQKPIAITVNGREDTILLNYSLYVQQMEELQLLRDILESEQDFENGNYDSADNVFNNLRGELKERYGL